ncbi:MAG: YkgJ family cysteine cluster protein [Candidatus Aenigmarchaeota archaeon]|nr:YkgJ family cysteine cluster protein [Candidatus Aenigmarchaeota archaeon]
MTLNQELQKIYDTLPKMKDPEKCARLCKNKICKHECCTLTGAGAREKHNINRFIKERGLKLPYVQNGIKNGYLLPFKDTDNGPVCEYVGPEGCLIYEVRPLICRLFATVKNMPCTHMPEEIQTDEEFFDEMCAVGIISKEDAEYGKLHKEEFNSIARQRRMLNLSPEAIVKNLKL